MLARLAPSTDERQTLLAAPEECEERAEGEAQDAAPGHAAQRRALLSFLHVPPKMTNGK